MKIQMVKIKAGSILEHKIEKSDKKWRYEHYFYIFVTLLWLCSGGFRWVILDFRCIHYPNLMSNGNFEGQNEVRVLVDGSSKYVTLFYPCRH